jgi:hypothetical protein
VRRFPSGVHARTRLGAHHRRLDAGLRGEVVEQA